MSFSHRLPAIAAAFLSTVAVLLLAYAGFSCEFLILTALDTYLVIPEENEGGFVMTRFTEASIGISCDRSQFFDKDGDDMWELSWIFWVAGLALGSSTAFLSWAVSIFLKPTSINWKAISVLAALTAVVQVPAFLILEAEPCSDYPDFQTCSLGHGAYLLMASDVLFIAVCLITQCFDPPLWALELEVWKRPKRGASRQRKQRKTKEYIVTEDEDNDQVHLRHGERRRYDDLYSISSDDQNYDDGEPYRFSRVLPASENLKKQQEETHTDGLFFFVTRLFRTHQKDLELPAVETESTKDQDEYDSENQIFDDDSHLVLRVLPDGTLPVKQMEVACTDDTVFEKSVSVMERNRFEIGNTGHLKIATAGGLNEPTGEKILSNDVERHHTLDSPQRNIPNENPISSDAILADLQIEETVAATSRDDVAEEEQMQEKNVADSIFQGVRKLTNKLKRDSKRRKPRRQIKNGYAQMLDDAEYDSDDGVGMDTPPLEVQLPLASNNNNFTDSNGAGDTFSYDSHDVLGIQFQMEDVSDDDDDDIYLENEPATSDFDTSKLEGGADDPFACGKSFGSCHSDPECALSFSGAEDAQPTAKYSDDHSSTPSEAVSWEEDELSGDHLGLYDTHDSQSRGRSSSREANRRKRRAVSPVESIKSHCSLLHTTINEETEEDIKEELGTTYSLSRTLSAPEPRSFAHDISNGGVLKKLESIDLVKTLDLHTATNTHQKGDLYSAGCPEDEGDIPMLQQSELSIEQIAEKSSVSTPKEDLTAMVETQESALDGVSSSDDSVHIPLTNVTHTWKEPELPSKKLWKDPTFENDKMSFEGSNSPRASWKEPVLSNKEAWKDSLGSGNNDITDETSDTDETGCLSGTTDSFSDDSSSSANEVGPQRIMVRSRSFGCIERPARKHEISKSLSPTRSRMMQSYLSRDAREIRMRRIQRLKGYVPLDDKNVPSDDENCTKSPTANTTVVIGLEVSPDATPKRKTALVSPDEKKEDDSLLTLGRVTSYLPKDLFQPDLDLPAAPTAMDKENHIVPPEESDDDDIYVEDSHWTTEVDSDGYDPMLEQLDLQLIDLQRPVGAEYGDDERSM